MELKTKKRIAREVLLFFGTLVLTGLFYLSILTWNLYLDKSSQSLKETNNSLRVKISKLPQDRLGRLYNRISDAFRVNYQVDDEEFAIPKFMEQDFLHKYPNAKKRENYPDRYSYFNKKTLNLKGLKVQYNSKYELGQKLKKLYPSYSELTYIELADKVLKKYSPKEDSIIVLDYVDIDEFRSLMSDESYRNNFFIFASNEYDIGTRDEYDSIVQEGLKYNDSTNVYSNDLYNELISNTRRIRKNIYRIVDKVDILDYTLIAWLITLVFLYPIRLIFIALRWSIKTIKK